MAQIKESTIDGYFNLNGLDYEKGDWGFMYLNQEVSSTGVINDRLIQIGIRYKKDSTRVIQNPIHYFEYTDGDGVPYTSLDSLVLDLITLMSSGDSPITAELQAILDRADLEGFTKPSSLVQSEMNTLILAKKASGIWDKGDVFFNFAYNDATLQDFSRIDWKNPTGTLGALFGGISYGIQGFVGDGVNGKFDTGFTPSTDGVNYTLDDASRFMVLGTLQGSGGGSIDFNSTGFSNTMQFGDTVAHRINQSSGNLNAAANLINDGFKGINRTSSTNVELFNKSTQISRTSTSTSLDAGTQTVLGGFSFTNRIASCYQMGASVVSETPQFITDYNTYLTNIGLTAYA